MKIGLIAGGGQFPGLFAQKAVRKGYEVVAAGFHSETDPGLADHVKTLELLYLGQVNKLLKFFQKRSESFVRSTKMLAAVGSLPESAQKDLLVALLRSIDSTPTTSYLRFIILPNNLHFFCKVNQIGQKMSTAFLQNLYKS